ncbi:glycosyltransferase [Acetobacter oeni]|uniref:Glycosyltransferase 2-like domain-containing protein n=1 Tax=Acetobacter oeni TaxID=304077 RepID=A0A511XGW9_9PROT|nr:glycosyltransferase [Acetobacter oeni]MBB3882330.1 GT2 family glycosyltransferase/glycosyltransferase involved in cell wall biosynthesis/DNA-binding transcriptional MerR regulator [Acetobacter oeni]NHO18565.1 glycosyltransferase [Acetobacter oeni]GBR02241.1 glycosyltransferase [Acetobacter oeni LMG 21952]GEN62193.1 hypothetical protein AOE01nite_04170 [Acetobacter oeni]
MPAASAENCVFSLLADSRLGAPFNPPPGIDASLCQYTYLPLLAVLIPALHPADAVFIDSAPSVITYARQIVSSQELGTRIQVISSPEHPDLSPTSEPFGFVHYDFTQPLPAGSSRYDQQENFSHLLSQLSPTAIIALHGTETREGSAAWKILSRSSPNCLFSYGEGLGLIAPGQIPETLTCLLGTDEQKLAPTARARLFARLEMLGTHWADLARLQANDRQNKERATASRQTHLTLSETRIALATRQESLVKTQQKLAETNGLLTKAQRQLSETQQQLAETEQQLAETIPFVETVKDWTGHIEAKNAEITRLNARLTDQESGLTALRSFLKQRPDLPHRLYHALLRPHFVPTIPDPVNALPPLTLPPAPSRPVITSLPAPTSPDASSQAAPETTPLPAGALRQNVLFISGEPNTPGTLYRCTRNAAVCASIGHNTRLRDCAAVTPDDLSWAGIVILWRASFSEHVSILIRLARENGAVIIFDVDDLVFIPALANVSLVDGIRTTGATEEHIASLYTAMRATMDRCDGCFTTTETLAREIRRFRSLAFTLPNTFDALSLRLSRAAARARHAAGSDGLIRIGYAAGTRTHQKDFAVVAETLAKLLRERSGLRLVLFREPGNKRPIMFPDEFPCLAPVSDRIEWQETVPLPELPGKLALFDISIAPLQPDSTYCDVKSEIKFFEAALAGVPSVVSPTEPYRKCITNGVTGFLASTPEEWERHLTTLIDDPALRARMARDALNDVLWNFSPERQAMLMETAIASLGNEIATARATETWLVRGDYRSRGLPQIADNTILFEHDSFRPSDVTVIITSHNYESLIVEALESVRVQTIANLDLIVVDDASTDQSVQTILDWATRHAERFNRLLVLAPHHNIGLGAARNIAVSASETRWFLSLDADNRLLPDACDRLLARTGPLTAYVYPQLREFGGSSARGIVGTLPARPLQLISGNYIDAMALVAKWAWAAAGGYYIRRDVMGWEDYDLWCTLGEMGLQSTHLPEVVAEYRVHETSMTNSVTEHDDHRTRIVTFMTERHPWLDLHREAQQRV